jgi:hypothetical protein
MLYEIAFTKKVPLLESEEYVNDCCRGGDVIRDYLLPAMKAKHPDFITGQEDWGWYIWMKEERLRLELGIHCDDFDAGEFRIILTARRKGIIFYSSDNIGVPELDSLKDLVMAQLGSYANDVKVERQE